MIGLMCVCVFERLIFDMKTKQTNERLPPLPVEAAHRQRRSGENPLNICVLIKVQLKIKKLNQPFIWSL